MYKIVFMILLFGSNLLFAEKILDEEHRATLAKGCNEGKANDCIELGVILFKTDKTLKRKNRAFKFFHKACDLNNSSICSRLAATYENNLSIRYDLKRAIKLYEKSCSLKDAFACDRLGHIYNRGEKNIKADAVKSLEYFSKTCQLEKDSCGKIGLAYSSGIGLVQDINASIKFHLKACDFNETQSCNELGRIYLDNKQTNKAKLFLEKSCKNSSGWACAKLGGINKDVNKSVVFYEKACDLNSRTSCSKLAKLYLKKDNTKALKYLKKACDKADAKACAMIANIYLKGEGVPANKIKALSFLDRACKFGDKDSCKK